DKAVCKYREAVRVSCPKDVREKILEGKEESCPQPKRRGIITALLNFRSEHKRVSCTDAIIEWGIGLSVMNNSAGAIEKYKQAEEVDRENPRVYSEWGYELDLQGKENEADALFTANFPKCDKYRNDASLSYKSGDRVEEMNVNCSDFY